MMSALDRGETVFVVITLALQPAELVARVSPSLFGATVLEKRVIIHKRSNGNDLE